MRLPASCFSALGTTIPLRRSTFQRTTASLGKDSCRGRRGRQVGEQFFGRRVHGRHFGSHEVNRSALETPTVTAANLLSRDEIESALAGLSAADWHRIRRWARRRAENLPGWTGDDLLQEAMCKFLEADRTWKRSVPPLVALAKAMHSISSNIRKSGATRTIDPAVQVDVVEVTDGERGSAPLSVDATDHRTPAAAAEAKSELEEFSKSLAGDEEVELVAMAWMDGLRGKEAAEAAGLDAKSYDAARKRLMRKLDEFKRA